VTPGILITGVPPLGAVALKPRQRPFSIYDATISYPNDGGDTIPVAVAIIVPFFLIIISLCVGELILFRQVKIACSFFLSFFLSKAVREGFSSLCDFVMASHHGNRSSKHMPESSFVGRF
jgi:hypothetical protein